MNKRQAKKQFKKKYKDAIAKVIEAAKQRSNVMNQVVKLTVETPESLKKIQVKDHPC